MASLGILAGAALIGLAPGVAWAAADTPPGASAGAPAQPGSWGRGGWQDGGAPIPGAPDQAYASPSPRERHHGDYHRVTRGAQLPETWRDPAYTVRDWHGWGFAQPGPGMRWVRYYDDAVLIDGEGRVVDTRYDVGWERGDRDAHAYAGGPDGYGYGYPVPPPGYGYPAPGVTTYRSGPSTTVTTSVVQAPPPVIYSAPGYGYGGGYAAGGYYGAAGSIITVTPGIAVTTTTTTTDYETVYRSVAVRKRVVRRPVRHYHPRCVQRTCPVLGS